MVVVSLLAHPDDAEFLCAGSLIRLQREHGAEVHIVTMTAGDCGSQEHSAEEISQIRRAEAAAAAQQIGARYHCLEELDLRICYNERSLEKVVRVLRATRAEMVLTHHPSDYMLDHEMTSTLARAACFAAPVPNYPSAGPRLDRIPHLYYCDPIEGKDSLGRAIRPRICVDISDVIEEKTAMLAAHASQREWLLRHHGSDDYLESMKMLGRRRGELIEAAFGEGFTQHLGHAYPQDDRLGDLLGCWPAEPWE